MKVLIVTQYYWPENFRINDLAAGLVDRSYEVTVLTGKPNYPTGRLFPGYGAWSIQAEVHGNTVIKRVPLVPRGRGGAWRLVLNYISFMLAATALGPFLCRERYDVILVYEPSPITVMVPALWFKRLRGIPVFLWVQDLWPDSLSATGAVRSAFLLRCVERLVRAIYKRCDCILVQSRAFIRSIETLGIPRQRIRYFPNSAESLYTPITSAPDDRAKAGIPQGFVVMFAGNVGAAQDFQTIIRAAEHLRMHRDVHWVIVGDGRARPWVEEEVQKKRLSSNFHLLGSHPIGAMPRLFAMADAMLVTLKKEPIFAMTIPSKLQSYLACGRPVVAALDGEGASVLLEAGAGIAVNAEDPAALADAVLELAGMDPGKREAMGRSGRRYFEENFGREMLLDRLDSWFRETHESQACAS